MVLTSGISTFDNVLKLLGLILLFIIILAATYFTTRFIGQFHNNQIKKSNFKIIETLRISQGKHLMLIAVSSKYFVIALGKNEITVVAQLAENEVILKDGNEIGGKDFLQYLSKFTNKADSKG